MGKTLSLIAKCIAIVFAIIAFLVFKMDADGIVKVALVVAGIFTPIDISMITKNVKAS